MARSGFGTTALGAALVLWAVTGCKVTVAELDLHAFLDVPADLAGDPGVDVPPLDVPGDDVLPVDTPADDMPPADVPPEDVPPTGPCGSALNPNCTAAPCDDGDPATADDRCVLGATPFTTCTCRGTRDPCGTVLNPQCKGRQCDLDDGTQGLCQVGTEVDTCTCTRVDVCRQTRPVDTCQPLQCWQKDGSLGICNAGTLLLTCACEEVREPCGSVANPQCWSNVCDLGLKGEGRCRPSNGTCECVKAALDPCNDADNPKCTEDKCELLNNVRGQCQLGPLGLCGCGPVIIG